MAGVSNEAERAELPKTFYDDFKLKQIFWTLGL